MLPPINEQHRIVTKLDAIFTEIDKSIELNSKKLLDANAMISSTIKTNIDKLAEKYGKINLSSLCKLKNGFAFKSNKFRDNGTPILRISNIRDGNISTKRLVYASQDDYKEDLNKYKIGQGALLIAMSETLESRYQ